MKKKVIIFLFLFLFIFVLSSCKHEEEEAQDIVINAESTLIETDKTVSDFGEDYKSILYAYLNNYYNKLESVKIENEGTLKAKILFINYNVTFGSTTIRLKNSSFRTAYSHSSLLNYDSELYETRENVVESLDLETYKTYSVEEYKKIGFSTFAPLLFGFICNDSSVLSATLDKIEGDNYTFKYIFDVNEATKYQQISNKHDGDLTEYPEYISVVVYVTMKNDYTPVGMVIDASYYAKKPFIGQGLVEQHSVVNYTHVNEDLKIEDEDKYIKIAGSTPSQVQEEKENVLVEVVDSVKKLPFNDGARITANIKSDILKSSDMDLELKGDLQLIFDLDRVIDDNVYNVGNLYLGVQADENMSSLLSLVSMIAGDALDDYKDLLSTLYTMDLFYLGDGKNYIECKNSDDVVYYVKELKLVEVVDLLLKKLKFNELKNVIQGDLENQYLTVTKEVISDKEYKAIASLSDDYIQKIKDLISDLLEKQPMLGLVLSYKDFGNINIYFNVKNETIDSAFASVSYINTDDQEITLLSIELNVDEFNHKFEDDNYIYEDYDKYLISSNIASSLSRLYSDFYLDYGYKANALKVIEEYDALDDFSKDIVSNKFSSIDFFKEKLAKIDDNINYYASLRYLLTNIDSLDNEGILNVFEIHKKITLSAEVNKALGDELTNKYNNISDYVDYLNLGEVFKDIDVNQDVDNWGLKAEQIIEFKTLFNLCNLDSNIMTKVILELGDMGFILYFTISSKILNY